MSLLYSVWWNGKSAPGISATLWTMMAVSRKSDCAIIWVESWTSHFFFFFFLVESYFYWQANYGYSDRGIWQTFSWKLRCEPCQFKKNNLTVFIANDKIQAFKWKLEFWKLVSTPVSLISCQYLKTFQMRLLVILTNVIWGILCNEMCQYL